LTTWSALVAILAGCMLGASAAEASSPVRSVSVPAAAVTAGKPLPTTIVMRGARPAKLAFFVSRDKRRSRADLPLGVKRVRPGHGGTSTVRLHIPRRAVPLAGAVLACGGRRLSSCTASPQRIALIAAPHPLHARPVPGGAPAAASLGPPGGSLAVPQATLTVPAGALGQSAQLNLTPIASLGHGLPGHLVAALQASPPGLALLTPATLAFAGKGSTGVAFAADGSSLHLVPVHGGRMPMGVLGGAGTITAPRRQLRTFARRHVAADALSQLEQLLAAGPAKPKRRRHHGRWARLSGTGGGDPELEAYAVASAYQIEAEGNADFVAGVSRYQEWVAFAAPYSAQVPALPKLEAEAKSTLIAAGLHQVLEDQSRCEGQHELSRRPHMLELEAAGTALGAPPVAEAVQHAIAHCFQFDVAIDSTIHHVDREVGFEGGFDWHLQAKAPLDYLSLLPTATHFSVQGNGPGVFATASGRETSIDQGGCHDGTDVTEIAELLDGSGGAIQVSGDLSVPLAAGEVPAVELTVQSSAIENYRFEVQDSSNPECSGGGIVEAIPLWWTESWLSLVSKGGVSKSMGGPVTLKLEPPAGGSDPDLLGQLTAPALDSAGDSGQTRIELIHDPGHLLLAGLPPG
jgi:hypothetical protein